MASYSGRITKTLLTSNMGSLRLIFALSVAFAHSYGFVFVGGRNAVQLFYMISGYLISYLLVQERSYSTTMAFYLNRWLRIYPVYITVAVLALGANLLANPKFFEIYHQIPPPAVALLIFSNAAVFGQDWVMFAGIREGNLTFVTDFYKSEYLLFTGLLVPQAWTLGVELCFYLVAPFILVRRWLIYVLFISSVVVRLILFGNDIGNQDPWTYRFFPTELALFLAGALSHQLLSPQIISKLQAGRMAGYPTLTTYAFILFSVCYFALPFDNFLKTALLFVTFFFTLPFAFVFQNAQPMDRFMGELSYPVYVGHGLVLSVTGVLLRKLNFTEPLLFTAVGVVSSLLFAWVLHRAVEMPIGALRRAIKHVPQDVRHQTFK